MKCVSKTVWSAAAANLYSRGQFVSVLLLVIWTALSHWAYGIERRRVTLTEGWQVKQLDSKRSDLTALTRGAALPDGQWPSSHSLPASPR